MQRGNLHGSASEEQLGIDEILQSGGVPIDVGVITPSRGVGVTLLSQILLFSLQIGETVGLLLFEQTGLGAVHGTVDLLLLQYDSPPNEEPAVLLRLLL